MKNLLVLICLFAISHVQAQSDDEFEIKPITVGKLDDGSPITGKEYITEHYITGYSADTERREVLFELANEKTIKGVEFATNKYHLSLCDLSSNTVRWTRDIKVMGIADFQHTNSKVIKYIWGKKSVCYDKVSGEELWTLRKEFNLLNDKLNTGITNSGTGVDLTTGETKWKRSINNELGWNDIEHTNDETIIITTKAGTVHKINIKDGSGWDYKGDWTDKIYSNVLFYDNKIYFISKQNINCLDSNGNIVWQKPVDKKLAHQSIITNIDGGIFTILYKEKRPARNHTKATAVIAMYHPVTGEARYVDEIITDNRIIELEFIGSSILLHCQTAIYKYNVETGEKLYEKMTKGTPLEHYIRFASPYLYVVNTNGDYYQDLSELYDNQYFLMNKAGDILRTDFLFNPIDSIRYDDLWRVYKKRSKTYFIKHNDETIVVKDGKKVLSLEVNHTLLVGDMLVDVRKHSFRVINLSKLLD